MRAIKQLTSIAESILSGLPDRFSDEDVSAEKLACLFMLQSLAGSSLPVFPETLSQRLLDYTIHRAMRLSPWYAETYSRANISSNKPFNLQDLEHLPVFTRANLEQHGEQFRCKGMNFGYASFTTGTSSGCPLIMDTSLEEHEYVNRFFSIIGQGAQETGVPKPIALNLTNAYHGHLIERPIPLQRVDVFANSVIGLNNAKNLLLRTYAAGDHNRSISALGGSLIPLLRLTAFLQENGLRDQLPKIEFVQSTSEYITPKSYRTLSQFWNCPVEDRYGLSEICIGAWRCHDCGYYHFEPYGIPEVIGLHNYDHITEGKGRLVLTGFAPFMQMTPMIRYLTGDGIEIISRPCITGQRSFKLLGRLKNSLIRNEQLIGEYEIMDVLDEEPEVYRRKPYWFLPDYLQDVGAPPQFILGWSQAGVPTVDIELKYDPETFPGKAEALKQRLQKAFATNGLPAMQINLLKADEKITATS